MALSYTKIKVEVREILLRRRPSELYAISSKGTVPVLYLVNQTVIDESLDIMIWALQHSKKNTWLNLHFDKQMQIIAKNDNEFKYWLDRYKYFDRYPENTKEYYREKCNVYLISLENMLKENYYLFCKSILLADVAIFPFIRQYANIDSEWFGSNYKNLNNWLNQILNSSLFISVMIKYDEYVKNQAPLITNFKN